MPFPAPFTSIEMVAAAFGGDVVIQRPSGSSLTGNGPLCQGVFGVDGSGNAYYDTDGPTVGQAAVLGWDGSTSDLFVDSRNPPDMHLMLLRGPVTPRERRDPPAARAPLPIHAVAFARLSRRAQARQPRQPSG